MANKKIYQIEIINQNGEQDVPMGLFDWQVFETREDAQIYADEFITQKYTIVEYDEGDIEDYSVITMPRDRNGNRIHLGDNVKWHDFFKKFPSSASFERGTREEKSSTLTTVISVSSCDLAFCQVNKRMKVMNKNRDIMG